MPYEECSAIAILAHEQDSTVSKMERVQISG